MAINKVGAVTAGVCINPNTFTRSLSQSYENLGDQINKVADIFTYGQRAPVSSEFESRWSWEFNSTALGSSINAATDGLDGTSIYTYASADYYSIDPLFVVYNPDDEEQNRPATLYESFINIKKYVNQAIIERTANIVDIVSTLDVDLTGVADGTLICSSNESLSVTNWIFEVNYGAAEDDVLISASGNKIISNLDYIGFEAPYVKLETNYIELSDAAVPPTGAQTGVGRLYYSVADSSLRLVNHDGYDTVIGGLSHEEVTVNTGDSPVTMTITQNTTTYLVDSAAGSVELELPELSTLTKGTQIVVADATSSAFINNIGVIVSGSDQIIGQPSSSGVVIDTANGLVGLQATSIGWLILYSN